ncbi:hypothetical protein BGX28_006911 [Mortierella sp. GBA30]|nr:hypothetical protein BGX28_006911 [Mortierella sp. GBA30]
MKKFATLKNSVQSYPPRKEGGHGSVFASSDKPSAPCADCKSIVPDEPQCLGCSYKGLPDASVSSWDPVSGDIAIILSHGVIVKEHVAAVGVFIGKQVHMGFLKGSLAQEMLSTDGHRPDLGISASLDMSMRRRMGGRRGSQTSREGDSMMVEIPTPPCTPPRSPVLRPRSQFWQTQKKALECLRGVCRKRISGQDGVNDIGGEEKNEEVTDKETYTGEEIDGDDDDEAVEQFQVLTLLRPLVSDMYSFRIIPTGVISDPIVDGPTLVAPSAIHPSSSLISASPMTSSAYPTRAKRCTRLPCYPLRATAKTVPGGTCGPGNACDSDEALDKGINGDEEMNGNKSSQGVTAGRTVSCISMPCSPLLRSCSTYYPSLPTPPILTLCSAAVSALSKSIVASPTRASSPVLSSSSSSPALSLLPSPTLSSGAMFASSSASSLVSEKATSTVTTDREQEEEVEEEEREGCCPPPPSSPFEEDIAPLMDQSIYAAGAITGSKFVRYVLGNGVAVVADILKNET